MTARRRAGVIGVGNMGAPMAARLLERGFAVAVRDVLAEAEEPLLANGATRAQSPLALARECESIHVVVVDAAQIGDVLEGAGGLLPALEPGKIVMLHSTIAPADATRLAAAISARGAHVLDAPISGGPGRARAGELSLMVAGSDGALEHGRAFLEALASRVFRVGVEPGLGATMKLVNNLLAGIHLAAGAEAFALGVRAGLDPATMLRVFEASSGQSWILSDRLARVLADDRRPRAQMHILAKDVSLALDLARSLELPAELAAVASEAFSAAIAAGLVDQDDSALIRWRASASSRC